MFPQHRFLKRLDETIRSGFRQILLYGHLEDDYCLCDQQGSQRPLFLNLHQTLLWYFLNFFKTESSEENKIILFYSGQNKDRHKSLFHLRPVFADELFPEPYPRGRWPEYAQRMQEDAANIVNLNFKEFDSIAEWLSAVYALLQQDRVPVYVVFENVETYWRRPSVDMEPHNDVDNYLSLYRQLLRRKNCKHLVLLTSTVQDIAGFHLAVDQMGRIAIPLPTAFEVETIYNRYSFDLGEKDEFIREMRALPLRRTRAVYNEYEHTWRSQQGTQPQPPMTLLRFRQYLAGTGNEESWDKCLQDKKISEIGEKIVGQARALNKLKHFFREVRQEVIYRRETGRVNRRLLGFRVLAGPTGVGKTEYFRQLSIICASYGIPARIFNCTEYTEAHSISRFTGSPPGYAGSPEGELGRHMLENPASVILFDEWEKAHLNVQLAFLKILEGELTLGSGQRVDFSNTLIFFTTNAGSGFLKPLTSDGDDTLEQENLNTVLSALRNRGVPPELEGRLRTGVVVFEPLNEEDARRIIRNKLENLEAEFEKAHQSNVRFDPSVKTFLLNRFQLERRSGARAVNKQIEDLKAEILGVLEEKKASKHLSEHPGSIKVWYDQDGKVVFTDPQEHIYQSKDLTDLWRYALENILHLGEDGKSLLETAFDPLVGQVDVKQAIHRRLEKNLKDRPATNNRKPMLFVFGGPTGVGKTETYHLLSGLLEKYYLKQCPVIFSMTEYLNESDKNKLIGSPPGYAGSNTGYLGEFLLNNPYSVICFDEFEKCHLSIKLLFLKLLEGELLLGSGDRVDLSNVLFIFTTNAGNRNFDPHHKQVDDAILTRNVDTIVESLKNDYLVPDELIGRIRGHIIPFHPFGQAEARELIRRRLKAYGEKGEGQCQIDDSVHVYLLDQFLRQPEYGARDLLQTIENLLSQRIGNEKPLSLWVDQHDELRAGLPEKDETYQHVSLYSTDEEERIAVHEAGHALCIAALLGPGEMGDISISTAMKNDAVGMTKLNLNSHVLTKEILFKLICILLAGRMAEYLVYEGNTSAGCAHDVMEANKRVRTMVCELGMAENNLPPIQVQTLVSGNIPSEYYTEMLRILHEAERRAQEILESHRTLLEAVKEALLKKGILDAEEFVRLWKQS